MYAAWIGKLGPEKESHVDVRREGVDVAECGFIYTRGRMTVVQQLPNVITARTHDFEPLPCDRTQRA